MAHADDGRVAALASYGELLGLAFQIADDLLDLTSSAAVLGKTPGKDLSAGKATYPSVFGVTRSRDEARRLRDEAVRALDDSGIESPVLRELAHRAVERTS